ncbi:response regulator [Oscillatoriales cyanobacterium LEGE 11467]|uniref:Response regulator n=1 Tax=Zarconia navalis LEGE 11467 TaxID=1828826 RepID=A0A928VXQ9_9CYAN|nr:response regulator [Zarconia navalis]MBE9040078.1 response regulator [Zarconia navalis LEGE 11467]
MSTILVVEDSTAQRMMIANLLKHNGMEVIEAKGGTEALQNIQARCPDLVILDIIMPNPNGYDVCRKIKGNATTQHVPIVMCSCKSEEFDRYWGMKMGADAYIAKPFHPDELLNAVQQLLPS